MPPLRMNEKIGLLEEAMRPKKIHYFMLTIILAITVVSCSQKFPVPMSEDTGVLVIAQEAVNETKNNFGYRYVLNYLPETSAEISIMPSTNQEFIIIDKFPVGSYWISGVTTIGIIGGIDTPLTNKNVRSINGESFEIKRKHVTILKTKF